MIITLFGTKLVHIERRGKLRHHYLTPASYCRLMRFIESREWHCSLDRETVFTLRVIDEKVA